MIYEKVNSQLEKRVNTAQTTADNAIARLDNMGVDLLWTNASPTSNFGAQSITVSNLSKYKAIDIALDVVAGGAGWDIVTVRIYKDWTVEISAKGTIWDSASYTYSRSITVDWANNKITFAKTGMGANSYENRMIPYTIHGIK